MNKNRIVITYGTFDLFHIGHLNVLKRARELGDSLVVAVSTDEFNAIKGKKSVIPYGQRMEIVRNISCVDKVIPENNWEQKISDIQRENISVFAMGGDWSGKFDDLKPYCEVTYLERTQGISSTEVKELLRTMDKEHIESAKKALDLLSSIIDQYK